MATAKAEPLDAGLRRRGAGGSVSWVLAPRAGVLAGTRYSWRQRQRLGGNRRGKWAGPRAIALIDVGAELDDAVGRGHAVT